MKTSTILLIAAAGLVVIYLLTRQSTALVRSSGGTSYAGTGGFLAGLGQLFGGGAKLVDSASTAWGSSGSDSTTLDRDVMWEG